MWRVGWWVLPVAVAVVAAAACQPVDEIDPAPPGEEAGGETEGEGGEPDELAALESAAESAAREWDGEAQLVEVSVRVDDELEWREARVSYLAPDADRMLVIKVDDEGMSEQEPTLETLGFAALSDAALASVPALPESVPEPRAAIDVAEGALAECGITGDVAEVLYASGAPGGWDGSEWAPPPRWSITVLAEGGGVMLSVDGEVGEDPCLTVP